VGDAVINLRPRPLIGVTTSEMREPHRTLPSADGDPPQREIALGMVYLRAIERAGGVPVVLPPVDHGAIEGLLDRLDGLCLSGGPDLYPDAYGQPPHHLIGEIETDLDATPSTTRPSTASGATCAWRRARPTGWSRPSRTRAPRSTSASNGTRRG
jgi:hypothetical protein